MAQKTYKQIQDEADRMFGKGASQQKFEWRRAQQAAAGLEQERKTRGGVAGAYDRNKKLVQAAIPTLAGMFVPGASLLAGALAGGVARGLDREGKGGIGFDVKQGLQGAAQGAALGRLGGGARTGFQAASSAGGGLRNQASSFFRGAAKGGLTGGSSVGAPGPTPGNVPGPAPGQTMATGGYGQAVGTPGAGTGSLVGGATGGGSTLRNLLTNPQVIAGAAGGVADVMGQRSQQQIAEQQLAQQGEQFQQRFDVEEEERKRQQAQANRLAGFFMPRAQG